MRQQLGIHSLNHLLYPHKRFLNARPRTGVIIEYPVQYFAEAVVRVPLHCRQLFFCQVLQLGWRIEGVEVELHVLREKDDDEWRGDIVDALHVTAGRMAHVPDIQQSGCDGEYLLMIFWMRSLRKRLLSGRVRSTSSLINLKIFFSCASCYSEGFSM